MRWIRGTCIAIALAGANAADMDDDVSSLIQVGGLADLPSPAPPFKDALRRAGASFKHKFQSAEAGVDERLEWARAANAKGLKPVEQVATEPAPRVMKAMQGHRAQQVEEATDDDEDQEQVATDDGYLAGGEWRALSQHDSRTAQHDFVEEGDKAAAASKMWSEMDNEADSEKVQERIEWAQKTNEEGQKAQANKRHFQNVRTCHGFKCDPQVKGGTALFPNASLVQCVGATCKPSDCCFSLPLLPEYNLYSGYFMGRGNTVMPSSLAIKSPQGQMGVDTQLVTIDLAKYECYVSKECVGFTHQGPAPPLDKPVWVHFKSSPYMGKSVLPAGCSAEEVGDERTLRESSDAESSACREAIATNMWTSYILPMPNLPKRLAK